MRINNPTSVCLSIRNCRLIVLAQRAEAGGKAASIVEVPRGTKREAIDWLLKDRSKEKSLTVINKRLATRSYE